MMNCALKLLLTLSPFYLVNAVLPATFVQCADSEEHVLVLYYTKYCPFSQRVLQYLKSVHKVVPMKDLADDPNAKAELKDIGGKMQVPCLIVNGQAIYESYQIIQWLSQHLDELTSE